jgi:EpsI family protein
MKRYVFVSLSVVALGLSMLLSPQKQALSVGTGESLDLAAIAPKTVGAWQAVDVLPRVVLGGNPRDDLSAVLYDSVLTRTYRRSSDGAILWLVIAYGGDQRGDFSLHVPEMCYRSQGFDVEPAGTIHYSFSERTGVIQRVVAHGAGRIEPISYWVVMGDEVVTGQFNQKLRQLYYGLTGQIRRGTLVRVSMPTHAQGVEAAYREEEIFISELLRAWPRERHDMVWPRPLDRSRPST